MPTPKTPLEEVPVEWADEWICLESAENRTALREAGYRWRVVPPDDGAEPTGLIEVVLPEVLERESWTIYRPILVDPHDPWSDYVDVREIPQDVVGLPYWIHRRAEKFADYEAKKASGAHMTKKPPHLPTRCTAVKRDGTRCWSWASDRAGNGKCRAHNPKAFRAADKGYSIMVARMKMEQAAPDMADTLEELAREATSEQVRLKAAESILDRVGVSGSTDINVNGSIEVEHSAAEIVRGRIEAIAKRLEPPADDQDTETVEGEIVEEPVKRGA